MGQSAWDTSPGKSYSWSPLTVASCGVRAGLVSLRSWPASKSSKPARGNRNSPQWQQRPFARQQAQLHRRRRARRWRRCSARRRPSAVEQLARRRLRAVRRAACAAAQQRHHRASKWRRLPRARGGCGRQYFAGPPSLPAHFAAAAKSGCKGATAGTHVDRGAAGLDRPSLVVFLAADPEAGGRGEVDGNTGRHVVWQQHLVAQPRSGGPARCRISGPAAQKWPSLQLAAQPVFAQPTARPACSRPACRSRSLRRLGERRLAGRALGWRVAAGRCGEPAIEHTTHNTGRATGRPLAGQARTAGRLGHRKISPSLCSPSPEVVKRFDYIRV